MSSKVNMIVTPAKNKSAGNGKKKLGRAFRRKKRALLRNRPVVANMTLTRAKRITRKKKLKNAVQNIENKAVAAWSKLEIPTTTSGQKLQMPIDQQALIGFIEVLMAEYATNYDLFTEISPLQFMQYHLMCALLHIRRVGSLTGDILTSRLPVQVQEFTWAIPNAFAKYLEYLGKYKWIDTSMQTTWSYGINFANTENGWGALNYGGTQLDRTGLANWHFFPQTVSRSSDVYFTHGIKFKSTTTGVQTFFQFVADQDAITAVSKAMSNQGGTVTLGSVSKKAPDASAYARTVENSVYAGITGPNPAPTRFANHFRQYDPEVALMFSWNSISSLAATYYDRPIPLPNFEYDVTETGFGISSYPYYLQPSATTVYLGRLQTVYKSGSIKNTFKYFKQPLKSLFPQQQVIDGMGLSSLMAAAYRTQMNNKSFTPADDPALTYFAVYLTVAYALLQARVSLTEVNHINTPSMQINTTDPITGYPNGVYYMPQFTYCESSWLSAQLPPVVAAVLEGVGTIVQNGYLRVPVSNYNKLGIMYDAAETEFLPYTIVGPPYFSAYGFGTTNDAQYEIPNLYTTSVGVPFGNLITQMPKIPFFATGAANSLVDNNYVNNAYGFNPNSIALFPLNFSGGQAATIMDMYTQFSAAGNTVNQSPLIEVGDDERGSIFLMDANNVYDEDVTSLVGIFPATSVSSSVSGNPLVGELPSASIVCGTVMTPTETMLATLWNGSSVLNNDSAKPFPGAREYKIALKLALINGTPFPVIPNTGAAITAPFSADVPVGSGIMSFVNSIMNETFRPSTPFAKGLRKFVDAHPMSQVCIKGLSKHPQAGKYTQMVLRTFAHRLFSRVKNQGPALGDMGPVLKKLTPAICGVIQTVVSRSQVVSKDTEGKESSKGGSKSLLSTILNKGVDVAKNIAKNLGNQVLGAVSDTAKSLVADPVKYAEKGVEDVLKIF